MLEDVTNRVEKGMPRGEHVGSSTDDDTIPLHAIIDATILPRATATILERTTTPTDILPEQQRPTKQQQQPRYKSHPAITATALWCGQGTIL